MKMGIKVQFNNIIKFFGFLNYSNYSQLFVADEFIINCFKVHDHSYYYNAFFINHVTFIQIVFLEVRKNCFAPFKNCLRRNCITLFNN